MADTDIAVTSLTTSGGPGTIDAVVTYTGTSSPLPYLQLDHFEWWVAAANDRSGATHYADTTDPRVTVSGFEGEETRYFWARPVDASLQNKGDFYPLSSTAGVAGTSRLVAATDLDDGIIDLAKLNADVLAWQARAANSIRDIRETLQRIDQLNADNSARAHLDVRSVRQEVAAQVGTLQASVTLVDTFAALIEENADGITALGIRVTDIEVEVSDPTTGLSATVSAVSSLSATVSTQGDSITAGAAAILALEGVVGYESGSATFRLDMSYSPTAGWTNGWALQSRVDSGSTWRSIGIYGEVTASEGRVVLEGDQVVIKNGATVAALFDAGTTYITNARLTNLVATWAQISTAVVGSFVATSANIGSLQVTTLKLADGAVTELVADSVSSGTTPVSTSYQTVCSISVDGGNYPIPVGAYFDFTTNSDSFATRVYDFIVEVTVDSVGYELAHITKSIAGAVRSKIPLGCAVIPALPSGSYTVRLRQKVDGAYGTNHTVHSAKLSAGQPLK